MKFQKEDSSPQSSPNKREVFTSHLEQILIPSADLSAMIQYTLTKGCTFRFSAKGWSMSPFIQHNDVLTIAPMAHFKVGLGSIVAFLNSSPGCTNRLNVHRIVASYGNDRFLIKGDNIQNHSDGISPVERILGKVIKIERNGRSVNFYMEIERYAIAFLSRYNLLVPWVNMFKKGRALFNRGKKRCAPHRS